MRYQNPVITGFYPDPSICRVGEDYYLVTSSFEYFPGVPIFHSRDLIHWRQIGHCLTRASQLPLKNTRSSHGIFAPTLRYHNGLFYMVTTNVRDYGHFYVYTDNPAGEWSDPVWIQLGEKYRGTIDPSLFFDDDGKVYFTSTGGNQDIMQCEFDLASGTPLTEPRVITHGTGGTWPEGPHLYKINGLYYLMLAEGGTEYGHYECLLRSESPWGPFEACPHNPILTNRSLGNGVHAAGHADLVQAHDGSWWLVCLGIRPSGYPPYHHLGRETFLTPATWTQDGWLRAGTHGRLELEVEANTLPLHPVEPPPAVDHFDSAALGLDWNYLRNPDPALYSLTERAGWLRLSCAAATLDDQDSPAFVGRRQRDFICAARVLLDFDPSQDGDEAGLTVRMNEQHHYEIALTRRHGERRVIVRRRIGRLAAVVAEEAVEAGTLILEIRADREEYYFGFARAGQPVREIAAGEVRYLATETAGGFTGVYFGLYATGNGTATMTPAYFDYFEYAV